MLKFLTISLAFLLIFFSLKGQVSDQKHFQSPLQIPLFLSGNFGELRSAHFHAGLDFKTQGVTGHPVYASDEGFVARIKVQSGGYGQSIYISHPTGYTTVYAHLDKYIPEIERYVRQKQYARQSYEVDLMVPEGRFKIDKGQLIGYSGNTGRSGGPHLHFEIRKTEGQVPVNGLRFGFPVKDDIPPEFRTLYCYTYRNYEPNMIQFDRQKLSPLEKLNDTTYQVEEVIELNGTYLGIGTEIYDFLNGSSNRCGVYSLQLFIDEKPVYGFTIGEVPFSRTRFINAHMDYELKINEGRSVHRLFGLPYNELSFYNRFGSNGIYALKDFDVHHARIVAGDAYGNRSVLSFNFKRKEEALFDFTVPVVDYLVEWKKGRRFENDGLTVDIPAKALYQDINFSYAVVKGGEGAFSDTLKIHQEGEPLHRDMFVRYKIEGAPEHLREQLLFGKMNGDGKITAGGGAFADGYLEMKTRSFGTYVILADTLVPEIVFLGYDKATRTLSFKISDDLSGIQAYKGTLNGKWALFAYDAKSGKLEYTYDPERMMAGKEVDLKLEVTDFKGNEAVFIDKISF